MRKYQIVLLLFLLTAGFFLGVLTVNLCGDTYFRTEGIRTEEIWNRIAVTVIEEKPFFRYLLIRRLGLFLFLWMIGRTLPGAIAVLLYCGWLGFAAGLLLTLSFVQLGVRGILWMGAAVLPQGFFFGNCCWHLYESLWTGGFGKAGMGKTEFGTGGFGKAGMGKTGFGMGGFEKAVIEKVGFRMEGTGISKGRKGEMLFLLWNLPVLMAGILLECYVNPCWIRWLVGQQLC